ILEWDGFAFLFDGIACRLRAFNKFLTSKLEMLVFYKQANQSAATTVILIQLVPIQSQTTFPLNKRTTTTAELFLSLFQNRRIFFFSNTLSQQQQLLTCYSLL